MIHGCEGFGVDGIVRVVGEEVVGIEGEGVRIELGVVEDRPGVSDDDGVFRNEIPLVKVIGHDAVRDGWMRDE